MPSAQVVDRDRLREAMVYSAYLVERYGDAYAPVFERLADEWEAVQRSTNSRDRARRVLHQAEAEGGVTFPSDWKRADVP